MKLPLKSAVLVVSLLLGGCASFRLPGEYTHTIAKNPSVLSLKSDGRYFYGPMYSDEGKKEKGRWWQIRGDIVILVPDDSFTPHWFARIPIGRAFFDNLEGYHRSNDVRILLDEADKEKQ